jgi:hypothetical protein
LILLVSYWVLEADTFAQIALSPGLELSQSQDNRSNLQTYHLQTYLRDKNDIVILINCIVPNLEHEKQEKRIKEVLSKSEKLMKEKLRGIDERLETLQGIDESFWQNLRF